MILFSMKPEYSIPPKDIETGVEKEPAVQYYMVGADEWKKADKWPPE